MDEWLKKLKVGDTVIVRGWWDNIDQISVVNGETKTLFMVYGVPFCKANGREETTESHNVLYLVEATPEVIEHAKTEGIRRRVYAEAKEVIEKMNRAQLERVLDALKSVQ